MNDQPSQRCCPRCSSPVPADAPAGLCPRCLLTGAATPSDAGTGPRTPSPPRLEEIAAAFPDLEVLGFLGAGGMGCVYRVSERASGRVLALKVLPRELAADPAFVERFDREARTLTRLHHPNIVGIQGFGQSGGFCYLLKEHVDGANLRQALRAGRFTPGQALALIPHLCDALQYAHSQGVLHRDIKPENILLDPEGRVRIVDFGIAKILGEPGTNADEFTLTRTGARVGTPHYMAPEQVESPNAVDHRADIYSLGVVFYELLTGELPLGRFQAPSAKAYIDSRVDEIVFRALAKERELRQQSAGEVKAEVEGLAQPVRSPRRRRTRMVAGGLVVLVCALGLLVLLRSAVARLADRSQRHEAVRNLQDLGLQLRLAPTTSPEGSVLPDRLAIHPFDRLIDPRTGQPFVFLAAGRTNVGPHEILVTSPPRPEGRDVRLGDGSVQQLSEARFWEMITRAGAAEIRGLQIHLLGPTIPEHEADAALIQGQGATLSRSQKEGIHRLNVDLADAFGQTARGRFDLAAAALHGLLRGLPWDPDREVLFQAVRSLQPGTRPDLHEKTANRQGGLLAILAAFAAKTGDADALDWAQARGRGLWGTQDELVLCERRLDGDSDQDWEEVRMRTTDVLARGP